MSDSRLKDETVGANVKYETLGGVNDEEEEQDTGVPTFSVSLDVYAPIILFIFLIGGATIFSAAEHWSYWESLYFCSVSLATVGYGDITPNTNAMKIFTIVYLYFGIAFVASAVGQIVGRTVGKGLNRDQKTEDDMEKKWYKPSANQAELLRAWAVIIILSAIGTVFYSVNENMSTSDALYFSMITLASVGYGDISLKKMSTKIFDIFFILIGVTLMGMALMKFAEVWARMEQQKQIDKFVKQGVTMEVIQAIDEDKSGEIERAEFLAYMLVHMGKVESKDISQINNLFDKLDADGGGTLDVNDLKTQIDNPISV